MKVLLGIPSFAMGGAEKFVVDLAVNLDKEKYDVVVAETRANVDSVFRTALEEANIEIIDLSGKTYIEMLKKQIRYFRENRPDIIHTNIGSVLHMMLACWLFKIPKRIYTVHNEANLLYGNSKFRKCIYKLAFTFFGFIPVAISPTIKESIMQGFGFRDSKVPVVNNGVDIKRFKPIDRNDSGECVNVISVGTLYWIKNQEMIINAICNLHKKGVNIRLDLLGEGEDRQKLENLIVQRDASSYITLHGRKADVENYLQRAHIYVSASKTEGLPLSILEAMACGLPVVATAAGGTKDIVHDNQNGYLVPIDDQVSIEEAIGKLANDGGIRKQFGNMSRSISKEWSIQRCAMNYEKLYETEL